MEEKKRRGRKPKYVPVSDEEALVFARHMEHVATYNKLLEERKNDIDYRAGMKVVFAFMFKLILLIALFILWNDSVRTVCSGVITETLLKVHPNL